ncbi:MAG: response regulator [Porticoccaceae bacterium]|nr:response regulator [Porticoccaceae bacterium]
MNYFIVDDDVTFSSILSRVLRRQGHQVLTANNGSQAFSLCKKTVDIQRVILDLKLEHESGLAILKKS